MHTATMSLTDRATLLQAKLEDDGVPVTHEEARDLIIASYLDSAHF